MRPCLLRRFPHASCTLRLSHPLMLAQLDTRLVPLPEKQAAIKARAGPLRWRTPEFVLYYAVFILAVPHMWWAARRALDENNPNFPRYQPYLKQGWIFGRQVDNSDAQYRFFRDNLPLLALLAAAHVAVRRVARTARRTDFDLCFGLVFLVAAHGINAPRVLFHLGVNYAIGRIPNRRVARALLWTYGVGTLFANDRYRAVAYGQVIPFLSFIDRGFRGIVLRWDVFFNFTLLRMLSFNLDYLERQDAIDSGAVVKDDLLHPLDDRERLTAPHPLLAYSLRNYLSFSLYTPLYIAGPILTFNDYLYQSMHPVASITTRRVVGYGLRLLGCILTMEVVLHYAYVVAVSKVKAWDGDTPFEISMVGLFNLNLIWLKLLIPWRFFRLWALVDGIDPPENMIRCVDNNYSALAFWRAWHRLYNRWVLRYIYMPLGGTKNRVVGTLITFLFVAVWHDIELRMLLWGWLVVLFLLPEIFATAVFKPYADRWWFRHVCAVGAVVNIWMMMLANLFGFCLGKDGTSRLLLAMFGTASGGLFVVVSLVCLWVAAQVMFELREGEKRQGIDVRC